ncbi:MAG TPA: DUF1254 domain-containing protein, partial [Candidatus Limnocylindrales bacterium]
MATDPGPHDARAIAAEAFVFGYPLVLMDVSRQVFLNRPNADGGHDRVNEVAHLRAFPDASFKAVVSPNADTLYSTAWLDLRTEPMVLSQPDSGGRYHLLPILSAWTDVFTAPGTRTTGDGPASFAIVGPRWAGTLPVGVEEVHSPTAMAWLIGRTQTNGAADYDAVHRFQDELAITPLSGWGWAPEARADVPLDPSVDVETPPPDQVAAMDAATFFGRLAGLMVDNPPSAADAPMLEQLATIGLAPGRYEPNPADAAALDDGVRLGLAEIREQLAAAARLPTGW